MRRERAGQRERQAQEIDLFGRFPTRDIRVPLLASEPMVAAHHNLPFASGARNTLPQWK
jgi:hypothetical protein